MKEYLEPVSDEIIEDGLGGIFGKKQVKWNKITYGRWPLR